MLFLKTSWNICRQNFRKWAVDYRIWTIAAVLMILVSENTRNMANVCESIGQPSTIWIFPFLYSQYHQKLIFTLPLLLLFNNAPFIDSNAMFVISRCKKSEWHTGQFLYIICASGVYYLYILFCTVITSIPYAEFSFEWGQSIHTIANTNATTGMGYNFLNVSNFVVTYFTPVQAVWFTFLISSLVAVMLGMIIYFFNTLTKTNYIGCIISSIHIIFSCYIEVMMKDKWLWYSPVSWITLDKLDVGQTTTNPTFTYCMTVLLSVSLILFVIITALRKKWKMDIS